MKQINQQNQLRSSWPYLTVVVLLHMLGLILMWIGSGDNKMLVGMALVAYMLGTRHAFDPDHIAAIDNSVRKLLQENKKTLGIGFYFSLGHSSVVLLMSIALGVSAGWAQRHLPQLQHIGGIIGMSVSGTFLLIIGIINLIILVQLIRLFKDVKDSDPGNDKLEELLKSRGFFSRLIGPFYKVLNKEWHLYPLGFLFGLGFDTASEIALLALSASASTSSFSLAGILALPILFAAGMSLFDTLDGIFMTRAYDWAFIKPIRKLYYNITITMISVIAAIVIGLIEIFQLTAENLHLNGRFWTSVQGISLEYMGYLLVALFLVSWIVSYVVWKVFKIEERYS
ncbi:HoxN/HupN/NixA family nickel/cobalt transporter [Macrococcus equipercicus]|uniref:Nickel/cobalt efflux system n=1 Tax=Macrococcus equipercicus TaxID=69967 RepID=A0ABQ6RAV9_9STAP|nr:HoxN/HupN/NixA family nickel/cobalt transporter [Macrococcus equipercicus]KAA1042328.1 HoxN/HupN/NixA family nickel/cobalt transporter [Macrococcus equipercicus]